LKPEENMNSEQNLNEVAGGGSGLNEGLDMTDKELLELAAKASGVNLQQWMSGFVELRDEIITAWNPLKNNGDALKLAVKLGITVTPYPIYAQPKHSVIAKQYRNTDSMREKNPTEVVELYNDDAESATRRAIVRCAALMSNAKVRGAHDEFEQ
jgi:hypothetical protein